MRRAPRKYFTKRLQGRARRIGARFSLSKEREGEIAGDAGKEST
jgi:hypothetical protein